MRVKVDQAATARYGLYSGEVAETIQTAFLGKEVGQILEGQISFPLVVRYSGDKPADLSAIEQILLDTPSGPQVPLAAAVRRVEGEQDYRQAVIRGAAERVSPNSHDVLAAGLALVPVALGLGQPGSRIQAPMAIVILFGLLSSTALNLVVVPAVNFRFGQKLPASR